MSVPKQFEQTFLLEELAETGIVKLDSSQLVREIKNYPILYDNNFPRDQTCVFNAWDDICTRMLPKFSTMNENDKIATRKRLKDRWSYMRSTFRRDILSNKAVYHKRPSWVHEINFLLPILIRSDKKWAPISLRRVNWKDLSINKQFQHKVTTTMTTTTKTTTTTATTSKTSMPLLIPETDIINNKPSEDVAINNTIESSASDIITSSESNAYDISTIMDTLPSNGDQYQNDLLVETFMSTFSLHTVLMSPIDPDQKFLLTILQKYRQVRNDRKEALQHKFYTFLRD